MSIKQQKEDTDRLLYYLHALAMLNNHRTTPVDKTTYHTCDAKILKALLLETGGETTAVISATVYKYLIKKKHLGVGIYNVWLELILEKHPERRLARW